MPSSPEYVLPRDIADNNRINYHHLLWVSHFGYHLHPSIPLDNPNLRIADVGTGTGIFLTDLAAKLPSTTTLEGLDISLAATPPSSWLPKNVTFREWNIKDPEVPDDLLGAFDIIHLRHLVFVITSEEILGVLNRLVKLLKPGGYIQWAEVDVPSHRVVTAASSGDNPPVPTEPQKRLFDLTLQLDPRLSPKWVPELPSLFTTNRNDDDDDDDDDEGGRRLEVIEVDKRDAGSDPVMGLHMHECNLTIQELVASTAIKGEEDGDLGGGGGKTGEILREIRGLMGEVVRTTQEGAAWGFDRWCVVARKTA